MRGRDKTDRRPPWPAWLRQASSREKRGIHRALNGMHAYSGHMHNQADIHGYALARALHVTCARASSVCDRPSITGLVATRTTATMASYLPGRRAPNRARGRATAAWPAHTARSATQCNVPPSQAGRRQNVQATITPLQCRARRADIKSQTSSTPLMLIHSPILWPSKRSSFRPSSGR